MVYWGGGLFFWEVGLDSFGLLIYVVGGLANFMYSRFVSWVVLIFRVGVRYPLYRANLVRSIKCDYFNGTFSNRRIGYDLRRYVRFRLFVVVCFSRGLGSLLYISLIVMVCGAGFTGGEFSWGCVL